MIDPENMIPELTFLTSEFEKNQEEIESNEGYKAFLRELTLVVGAKAIGGTPLETRDFVGLAQGAWLSGYFEGQRTYIPLVGEALPMTPDTTEG